ncbi:MAG: 2Fe-2S iron-sulfur cluster-binding protein [Pyrinomonadaceae bacterium]
MQAVMENSLESFLHRHDADVWAKTVAGLLPFIHEVDRTATQIWFAFYPLALARALQQAEDRAKLVQQLLLQGKFELKEQIDSSHEFLYGHRFWPEVKSIVMKRAGAFKGTKASTLIEEIRAIAREAAAASKAEESLLTGICAVALMTLQQVGTEAFKAAPGTPVEKRKRDRRSPEQILRQRAKDDGQGLLGFLKTTDKEWTVTFDEADPKARFKTMNLQELASGAAEDKRDWKAIDPRRIEGPIPVECRSAACGTCWVGVLGGAEKLTDVNRLESKNIKEFGYIETNEPKPLIRLACQAQSEGAVSIVIPPWNGVFGKYLKAQKTGTEDHGSDAVESQAEAVSS